MPRSRSSQLGLLTLAALAALAGYAIVRLAGGVWSDYRTREGAALLHYHYRGLTDQYASLPTISAPGAGRELVESVREFCDGYAHQFAAVHSVGELIPATRPGVGRSVELLDQACRRSKAVLKLDPALADLRRTHEDLRGAARQALQELRAAVVLVNNRGPEESGLGWLAALGTLALFAFAARARGKQKRDEAAVRVAPPPADSAQWMRTVMEATSEGILIVEPEGRIRTANVGAERTLGYGRSELVGRLLESVLPSLRLEGDVFGVLEHLNAIDGSGAERACDVSWFRRKGVAHAPTVVFVQSGEVASLKLPAPARGNGQSPAAAERPVELERESLARLENEILLLTGFGEMALAQLPADSPIRAELEQLSRAAARAAALCREAVPVSALRATSPATPLALNGFVGGFEQRLLAMLEPGIDVLVRTDATAGSVLADAACLEQALVSLIFRSLPSVPEPKLIRLAVGPGRLELILQQRNETNPGWRRLIGEYSLPKAATWLAAQGGMLEQDRAESGGAYRYRLHLTTASGSGSRPSAEVA